MAGTFSRPAPDIPGPGIAAPARLTTRCPTSPEPERIPCPHGRPAPGGGRAAAGLAGRRRARSALRRRRPRAAPRRRLGARRAARPARRRPRLRHRRPPGRRRSTLVKGWAEATWETGREFGTIGAQRGGLRLEITTFRAEAYDGVTRNPIVQLRHDPARRPAPARLHGQRDGGQRARARVHRSVRRAGRSGRPRAADARRPRRSRSATIRCGCCARPGSPPSCGFAVAPAVRRRDDRDGRGPAPDHRRADPRRVLQAAAAAPTR